ncbi:MAG: stationary phase or STEss regulating sigma factor [Magnetococcales bacterium]|nr:stationary phase or STEss regulating sigma factor [Magnetococcales bacterium]
MEYFSDQQRGKREAFREDISDQVWRGILSHINALIDNGAFGESFPEICIDGPVVFGSCKSAFSDACRAEIPRLPEDWDIDKPDTLDLLDLIQFCFKNISKPSRHDYHDYFKHYHLTFNRQEGQETFLGQINQIFERNGIVFRLQSDGSIIRTLPPEFNQLLDASKTGNERGFDDLLNDAKAKIIRPDPRVRKEGLERLWDAWECLKTLEEGNGKKEQITKLLDKAASSQEFRGLLEVEAKALTEIGNKYRIRHFEQGKIEISDPRQIDYLFFRMLSMINLLLKARSGTP